MADRERTDGRTDDDHSTAARSDATGVPDAEDGPVVEGEETRGAASSSGRGKTGAGAEAAEGIHSSKGESAEERSGSEPLRHRETEHKSGYGGEKGEPKTSSDER